MVDELRPGRTGNEILAAARARMQAKKIDGTVYSHPIGLNGHGAGALIGLWDYQDGVAGRGDAQVTPSMWYQSSCRRRRRWPSGEDSASGWPRKKTSSSTPPARFAGR